jgi:hypothetical protein
VKVEELEVKIECDNFLKYAEEETEVESQENQKQSHRKTQRSSSKTTKDELGKINKNV